MAEHSYDYLAEHGILVVEHLFLFTQHSYLYVGRTLFLFFMKQEWINLSTPQGVLFEEYLSILENILARVRYPFRFPTGIRLANGIGPDEGGTSTVSWIPIPWMSSC